MLSFVEVMLFSFFLWFANIVIFSVGTEHMTVTFVCLTVAASSILFLSCSETVKSHFKQCLYSMHDK